MAVVGVTVVVPAGVGPAIAKVRLLPTIRHSSGPEKLAVAIEFPAAIVNGFAIGPTVIVVSESSDFFLYVLVPVIVNVPVTPIVRGFVTCMKIVPCGSALALSTRVASSLTGPSLRSCGVLVGEMACAPIVTVADEMLSVGVPLTVKGWFGFIVTGEPAEPAGESIVIDTVSGNDVLSTPAKGTVNVDVWPACSI